MTTHLLSRPARSACDEVCPLDGLRLVRGRAHEAAGPARRSFALWVAAATEGTVLWISPAWSPEQLNPEGMMDFVDPARFVFLHAARREDLLWACEESLRSGAAPLTVVELPAPPAMTPVRRLHLAAQAGGTAGPAPLALLLTPGQGGAAGIESRWHLTPAHEGNRRQWLLARLRARMAPQKTWRVQQDTPGARLTLQPSVTDAPPIATPPAQSKGYLDMT